MSLFLALSGPLLAFGAALVGIVGNTWDSKKTGIARLTGVGWAALLIALVGIALSTYKVVVDHRVSAKYEAYALNEIGLGWRQVATPWMLLRWEMTGERGNLQFSTMKELLSPELRAKFNKANFERKTKVSQYGDRTLGTLLCQQSSRGMKLMEQKSENFAAMINPEIVHLVRNLKTSGTFGGLLAAGCGTADFRKPNHEIFDGLFTKDSAVVYIKNLIELGKLLDHPESRSRKDG